MPRSCSSSDMAGTAMLYQSGTDGAAVTDVRLHGSGSSQHPESAKHQGSPACRGMSDQRASVEHMFDTDKPGSVFAAVSPPADVAASPAEPARVPLERVEEDGSLSGTFRLPPLAGAVLLTALRAACADLA